VSETDISRAIRDELKRLGFWPVRIQSGKVKVKGGWMQLAEPGTPDICLVGLGWFEVKTSTGERLPSQVAWHSRAAREGVRVATVRSVREAVEVAIRWEAER